MAHSEIVLFPSVNNCMRHEDRRSSFIMMELKTTEIRKCILLYQRGIDFAWFSFTQKKGNRYFCVEIMIYIEEMKTIDIDT